MSEEKHKVYKRGLIRRVEFGINSIFAIKGRRTLLMNYVFLLLLQEAREDE
jgi:hypothetical protein